MPALGLGIGIPFRRMGAGIDAQAQAHYDRVIADGGLIPSGLAGVNNFFKTVKGIYGTSDITTAVSVGLDAQVLGYKLGAGAGTTAGQAAQKLYSCSGSSGDVVQTTASSQPLLLVHSGSNYAWFPKVAGNYINSSTTYATNDIDIEFSVNMLSGDNSGNQQVIGTDNTAPFAITINRASSLITIEYYVGGFRLASAPFTWAATNIIRVTRNSTTGVITFINNGVTLTTSGSQVAGAFDISITSLCVGGYTAGFPFLGKINYANCYIGGVLTRAFNPSQYNAATSQTQWTSSTGEVWTINTGTATTGYKGVLVDRSIVQGDGVDDTLDLNTFILPQPFTIYPAFNNIGDTSNGFLFDAVNTSSNRVLMIRDGGLNFSYETTPSSGAVAISRTVKTLELNSVVFNGASSSVQRNNGSSVIGNIGSSGFTSLRLGRASGSGGSNGNYVYNTFIIVSSADNSTIRTSMYNYIRSINNNAF
jgi:hypothetical protein